MPSGSQTTMEERSVKLHSLLEQYSVTEEECVLQVSERHVSDIALSHCRKWRYLPSYLELEDIVKSDIDHGAGSEEEKRHSFLLKWREVKGSSATFKKLINALLEIDCHQDAESVCKLLKNVVSKSTSPARKVSTSTQLQGKTL